MWLLRGASFRIYILGKIYHVVALSPRSEGTFLSSRFRMHEVSVHTEVNVNTKGFYLP